MATPFIDFRPAQVMGNKEVYVCYYVVDPTSDKLKRMRVRCNRVRSPRERTKYATLLCAEINRKLYNGWNPLINEEPISSKRLSVVEAATDFVRQKEKDLRKDTVRSYRSKLAFFVSWCEKAGITEMLESGMPSKFVKDLAGHHSLSMTERYLHISDAKRILKANTIRF